jgi:DNA-binding NarL/FixJ family response regulator
MKNLRILLADDHELVRQGFRALLATQPAWTICGEASTGREAVALALEAHPDIVVMDLSMPELSGVEAIRQIRAALPKTEVLILTMHASGDLVREGLDAGARGVVLKTEAARSLVAAIEAVTRHEPFISDQMGVVRADGQIHLGDAAGEQSKPLTPRERQVLRLVAKGCSTKELADQLGMSVKTAETHRSNILRKLGLRSVSEMVRYAVRNLIVEP